MTNGAPVGVLLALVSAGLLLVEPLLELPLDPQAASATAASTAHASALSTRKFILFLLGF
jgi:hypothetical protein